MDFKCVTDDNNKVLAYLIRFSKNPDKTTFITPSDLNFQAGFVVYPKDSEIPRHTHLPIQRNIEGTSEVIIVRKGSCVVDIYNDDKKLVMSRLMVEGDVVMFFNGGHGFRTIEKTVLMEIKQGPYPGGDEKVRF